MIPRPMLFLYRLAIVLAMSLGSVLTGDATAWAVTWCTACLFAATEARVDPKT
jgi:hypothetical protein